MINNSIPEIISIQTGVQLLLWQLSLLMSLIFIIFFMIKILIFIRKASLYIDLKVVFMEHILQEITSS